MSDSPGSYLRPGKCVAPADLPGAARGRSCFGRDDIVSPEILLLIWKIRLRRARFGVPAAQVASATRLEDHAQHKADTGRTQKGGGGVAADVGFDLTVALGKCEAALGNSLTATLLRGLVGVAALGAGAIICVGRGDALRPLRAAGPCRIPSPWPSRSGDRTKQYAVLY